MYKIFIVFFLIIVNQVFAQNPKNNLKNTITRNNAVDMDSTSYSLEQNYPNPFNSYTTISYTIPEGQQVTLKIFNIIGIEVLTLKDQYEQKGFHTVRFNSSLLPSGIYFYTIKAGRFVQMKKITILK
jgi:hypothetical protein